LTQIIPTLDVTPHEKTDKIYTAFVGDEIQIVPGIVSLSLGSKFERNDYSGFEIQPSGRLAWTRSPRQTFWAAATRAMRTPSRIDHDLDQTTFVQQNPLIYLQVRGNPDFVSERLIGFEAGYRNLISSRLHVDVSAFHNEYDNLLGYGFPSTSVENVPVPHILLRLPVANGAKGTTDGFEIAPEWRPASRWQLKGSYSYLHLDVHIKPSAAVSGNALELAVKNSIDKSVVEMYERSSPHHRTIIQSSFNLPGNLEFDQTFRYVGALPAQKVDSYSSADLRLAWHFREKLEFSVVAQNLLQPRHTEFGRTGGAPVDIKRSAFVKVTWRR
jgi:iron complex outermembrane receptor protein